jgi:hypothetical protein
LIQQLAEYIAIYNMPSLDGVSRPSLASIKQASSSAFSKAQLMVGLKSEEDLESQQASEASSQRSSFVEEAADLLCPDLTFQQVSMQSTRFDWCF